MTTLKNLTDEELDAILSGVVDGVHPTTQETAMAAELKSLRAQLEPVYQYQCRLYDEDSCEYYIYWDDCNHDYYILCDEDKRRTLYTRPVPQAVSQLERDVSAVVGLLEDQEWAEHCSVRTELGRRLENAVTELYNQLGEESQPYIVPERMPPNVWDLINSSADSLFDDDEAHEIWNACRAAMLGKKQ